MSVDDSHSNGLSRRHALLALAALPACMHQSHYNAAAILSGRIDIPHGELSRLQGPADVLYVRASGLPGAIALRKSGADLTAVLAQCTHRNCELTASPQTYDCPCHGSRFDLAGEVLDGPAERALQRYQVTTTPQGASILVGS